MDRPVADQAAKPDTDWLGLAVDAYETSTTYVNANLRGQWEKTLKLWQSQHVDAKYDSDIYQKRSRLFRPKTRAASRKNEASCAAAFFSTKDVVSVTPRNDADITQRLAAEISQGVINFRLATTVPWFQLLLGAYQETMRSGVCISYQNWISDGTKDEPYVELVPPENIRIDPASDWIDPIASSPYVIHIIPMFLGDVQSRMDGEAAPWLDVDVDILLGTDNDESHDSTRLVRQGKRADPTGVDHANRQFRIVWVRRNIIRQDGVDWLFYTAGGKALLSEPTPLSDVYPQGRPYVMGCSTIEAFKAYPDAVFATSADIQSAINDITNQRLDNVKLALNKRYFIKRGAQVDIRSLVKNVAGSATLMNDPERDVVVQNTPDVTSSSFQEHDRLNLDFDNVVGSFGQDSVQSNRSLNETVGGMELLSAGANQVSELQLRMFAITWVERVLRQILVLEQKLEQDAVVFEFAGAQSPMFRAAGLPVANSDLMQGDLMVDVNVGIGSTNPKSQVEKFFYGVNSLAGVLGPEFAKTLNVKEVVKEVFGKLGYKDGARFFNFGQQTDDPRLAELQQQLQDALQKLAQKRTPEEIDAEIAKIKAETVKLNVDTAFAAFQAAQVVATVPQAAPLGDSLLQSAGWTDVNGYPSVAPPGAATQPVVADPAITGAQPISATNQAPGIVQA